jgi:LDH2 family malate/lactate/ureidoglycolate dehydrogenase
MKTFCSTKALCSTLFPLFFLTASAWANVTVSSPASGDTVSASAHYVASATTTTCSRGVASMGVYVDNQLIRVVNGTHLDTNIDLALGKRHTVVEEWDYCGGATFTTIDLTVANQGGVW